jgi:hypothetical protein
MLARLGLRCIQTAYDVVLIYHNDQPEYSHCARRCTAYDAEIKTVLIRTASSVDIDAARRIKSYDAAETRAIVVPTSRYNIHYNQGR